MSFQVTPYASVTATLQGSVSVWLIRAGVYGDGHLIRGGLPISVSYDENRPSYRDVCVDVSADLRILELEAGVFYQWKSCKWRWWRLKCKWGTRRTLYSFGRWSAYSLRRNMIYKCFWYYFPGRSKCCELFSFKELFNWVSALRGIFISSDWLL